MNNLSAAGGWMRRDRITLENRAFVEQPGPLDPPVHANDRLSAFVGNSVVRDSAAARGLAERIVRWAQHHERQRCLGRDGLTEPQQVDQELGKVPSTVAAASSGLRVLRRAAGFVEPHRIGACQARFSLGGGGREVPRSVAVERLRIPGRLGRIEAD